MNDWARWRDTNVTDLCRNLRETRDWHLLPILADALMDAGCDDEAVLAECRREGIDGIDAERLVAVVYSDETAAAVKWIEEQAQSMGNDGWDDDRPMTYRRIMEGAAEHVDSGQWRTIIEVGGTSWQIDFPSVARDFWRNYALVTGKDTEGKDDSFFGCSC